MIFWRKKEKLMTIQQMVASIENNCLFAKKYCNIVPPQGRIRIEKQYGITIEQLVDNLNTRVNYLKSLIQEHPEIEQEMPDKDRKMLTKLIRELNNELLMIIKLEQETHD